MGNMNKEEVISSVPQHHRVPLVANNSQKGARKGNVECFPHKEMINVEMMDSTKLSVFEITSVKTQFNNDAHTNCKLILFKD